MKFRKVLRGLWRKTPNVWRAGVRNQVGRVSNRVPRLQVWRGLSRGLDSSILQARYERFRYQR